MKNLTDNKSLLGYELLSSYPNIFHFVTTRQGGCSVGNYSSFNCSPFSGDNMESVCSNIQILLSAFPKQPKELVIPKQVHGTEVGVITPEYQSLDGLDALVTNEPGYCLCVSTADCVPILLYDPVHNAVAAIHAGWRGTVARIAQRTLEVMKENYATEAKDVIACIGPSISMEAFEVGTEVYDAFQNANFNMDKIAFWHTVMENWHIDLWEANRYLLMEAGVCYSNIEIAEICTYKCDEQFFSARRLGIQSGRILSGIMLC